MSGLCGGAVLVCGQAGQRTWLLRLADVEEMVEMVSWRCSLSSFAYCSICRMPALLDRVASSSWLRFSAGKEHTHACSTDAAPIIVLMLRVVAW
jgi:hypothetical protein